MNDTLYTWSMILSSARSKSLFKCDQEGISAFWMKNYIVWAKTMATSSKISNRKHSTHIVCNRNKSGWRLMVLFRSSINNRKKLVFTLDWQMELRQGRQNKWIWTFIEFYLLWIVSNVYVCVWRKNCWDCCMFLTFLKSWNKSKIKPLTITL